MQRTYFSYVGLILMFSILALLGNMLVNDSAIGIVDAQEITPGATRGMHLGNVSGVGWHTEIFNRIDGSRGGEWPGAVVVISNQVYDINRNPSPDCYIQNATIPSSHENIRQYLQAASAAGVKIIIRIKPSPGNFFRNWQRLSLTPEPANGDRCDYTEPWGNRSYDDIGGEILAIHNYNAANSITEFGFEPANEPNTEWYFTDPPGIPLPYATPVWRNRQLAWQDMDAYFTAIYNYIDERSSDINVLTPSMAQNAYAETTWVANDTNPDDWDPKCNPMRLFEVDTSGYAQMPNIYVTGTANDGYIWHNYWVQTHETWNHCNSAPRGQHVALYFPPAMATSVATKRESNFITEADLASNMGGQNWDSPLTSKEGNEGNWWDREAANSIELFMAEERLAKYAAVWALNIVPDDDEQNWHEAYRNEEGYCERPWFRQWWGDVGTPVPTCVVSPAPPFTDTPTPTDTATPTNTPTNTSIPTDTPTPTSTPTDTPPPTDTPTPTNTPTDTPTPTTTATPAGPACVLTTPITFTTGVTEAVYGPDVTYNSRRDEYLVVWGEGDSVRGQVVDGAGHRTEISFTLGVSLAVLYQEGPRVAYNITTGHYLVVWSDDRTLPYNIYGRLIEEDSGSPLNTDFLLSQSYQFHVQPEVTCHPYDSECLAVWRSFYGDRYAFHIRLVSTADGVTDTIPITLQVDVGYPVVAYNEAADEYLAAWKTGWTSPYTIQIAGISSTVSASLTVRGPYALTQEVEGERTAIACNPESNGCLVLWENNQIYGRQVLSEELHPGISLTVSSHSSGYPALAYNRAAEKYLAVWHRINAWDVYGQEIGWNGDLQGDNKPLYAKEYNQKGPRVAAGSEPGEYLVVWKYKRQRPDDTFVRGIEGVLYRTLSSCFTIYLPLIMKDYGPSIIGPTTPTPEPYPPPYPPPATSTATATAIHSPTPTPTATPMPPPFNVVHVLDVSQHMKEKWGQVSRLRALQAALGPFNARLQPAQGDKVGLVTFGGRKTVGRYDMLCGGQHNHHYWADVLGALTGDVAAVNDLIDALHSRYETPLAEGLLLGRETVLGVGHEPDAQPVLVVALGGTANVTLDGQWMGADSPGGCNAPAETEALAQAELARQAGIIVYGVAVGRDFDAALLEGVVSEPVAAHLFSADSAAELDAAYAQIATALGAPPLPVPTPTPLPPGHVRTLILWNARAASEAWMAAEVAQVQDSLADLARSPHVKGLVLSVTDDPAVAAAYAAWQGHLTNAAHANAVVEAIRALIGTHAAQYPQLRYLVLVGGDEFLPFYRLLDHTGWPESRYAWVAPDSTVGAALGADTFLTDDFYALNLDDAGPLSPIPQLAIGRLVETPAEITTAIAAFLTRDRLVAHTAQVAGYGTVADAATAQCEIFTAAGLTTACALIGDHWGVPDLRAALLETPADLRAFNGHTWHFAYSDPVGDILLAREVGASTVITGETAGKLLFTLGCQSGLNVPASNPYAPLDWPQVWVGRGTGYVANTGFTWGFRYALGLSEQLAVELARAATVDGTTLGAAVQEAKRAYYRQEGSWDALDEKVLRELILYGLPMYRIQVEGAPLDRAQHAAPLRGVTVLLRPLTDSTAPQVSRLELRLPPPEAVTTTAGVYYALDGEVQADEGQPLQPRLVVAVPTRAASERAHGAVWVSGSYTTITGYAPVIAQAELLGIPPGPHGSSPSAPAPAVSSAWSPALLHTLRPLSDGASLVVSAGQYGTAARKERLYHSLSYDLYYSASADWAPPEIETVVLVSLPAQLEVGVVARDDSGIVGGTVLYGDGDGEWRSQALTWDAERAWWGGVLSATERTVLLAQAVDGAGNVAVADNGGAYYRAADAPTATPLAARPVLYPLYLPLVLKDGA